MTNKMKKKLFATCNTNPFLFSSKIKMFSFDVHHGLCSHAKTLKVYFNCHNKTSQETLCIFGCEKSLCYFCPLNKIQGNVSYNVSKRLGIL